MSDSVSANIRSMSMGIIFSIVTLLFGFSLGFIFGAGEDAVKGRLKDSANAVAATVYENDAAKIKTVLDKSWVYMQRAHLHAGAMGTTALALSILLAFCRASAKSRMITSAALGIGGLGYSIYWMWAGFRAPGIGGTKLARESLDWLAIPTSAMFVFATVAVLVFFLMSLRNVEAK
ncbi:MAG: hypothetical protein H0X66_09685 [Verrucomicrobia bacterium]|nr:hypothetical protein [Verrucomicrobiota bacterium]